jgi:hypothetical protein
MKATTFGVSFKMLRIHRNQTAPYKTSISRGGADKEITHNS